VYAAEDVALSVIPLLNALALTVVVPVPNEMGPEYTEEEDDGSEPSVVKRTVAPLVPQAIVTS
jgi:hypothetical protein